MSEEIGWLILTPEELEKVKTETKNPNLYSTKSTEFQNRMAGSILNIGRVCQMFLTIKIKTL